MLFQGKHLFRALPVVVKGLVAPGVVEGGRGFKQPAGEGSFGNLVVPQRLIISHAVADAGIDEAIRLQGVHHVRQFPALGGGNGAGGVEPDQAQRPVLGQQLPHLGLDFFLKADDVILVGVVRKIPVVGPAHALAFRLLRAPVGVPGGVAAPVGMGPVQVLRIIQPQLQPLFRAGLRQFADDIPAKGGCVHRVKAVRPGTEQGEALVMLGGDHQIAHARRQRQIHPFLRRKQNGIEGPGQGVIFPVGNAVFGLNPFADVAHAPAPPFPGGQGVQSPVHHHAEFCVAKPLKFVHNRSPLSCTARKGVLYFP